VESETTIQTVVTLAGVGVHTGRPCQARLLPAEESGIRFVRTDLDGANGLTAHVRYVSSVERGTSLRNGKVEVKTTEHLLAACYALGVNCLRVELEGPELPVLDGSFAPYVEALQQAGLRSLHRPRRKLRVTRPVWVCENDRWLLALPGDNLEITCCVHYDSPLLGTYFGRFTITPKVFQEQLAAARTLGFARDAESLRARGLALGASEENTLVVYEDRLSSPMRLPDEPLRHKVGDLIGDLSLLGADLCARLLAVKPGHRLNVALARALDAQFQAECPSQVIENEEVQRILPHRYPFLFVDRILELEPGRRAVGIKNVAANEPFFQGHFPSLPIMPGVLIMEAMAQAAGVLVLRSPGAEGRMALFAGADKVRFRRSVKPGDQLRLEVEVLWWRNNYGKVQARATVSGEPAAEAIFSFALVNARKPNAS